MVVPILSSAARDFSQSSAPAACLASAKIAAGRDRRGGCGRRRRGDRRLWRRWGLHRRRRGHRRAGDHRRRVDRRSACASRRPPPAAAHACQQAEGELARHSEPERLRLEHEGLERTDEAHLDVPELDDVPGVELDALVVLAVDANAVGALQVDDRVVVAVAHDLRVMARDRSVTEDDVVLVRPPDHQRRAIQRELHPGQIGRQHEHAGRRRCPPSDRGPYRRARESGWWAARRRPRARPRRSGPEPPAGTPARPGPAGQAATGAT